MIDNNYVPTGPWIIKKESHKGKCLEILMFQDYGLLRWLFTDRRHRPMVRRSPLYMHLQLLIRKGDEIKPTFLCPQCKRSGVRFFLALGNENEGYTIGPNQTSCERQECKENLENLLENQFGAIHPIVFSSAMFFKHSTDRRLVVNLIKDVLELSDPLTPQKAFKIFFGSADKSPAPQ